MTDGSLSLAGRKGLVIGVADDRSIAWGCAKAFHALGAELALTYYKDKALPSVAPLADSIGADLLGPCNVLEPGQLEVVFDAVARKWGRLDFLLHSIAFAPREDLHGRVVDCSADGFLTAIDVSCHSFIRCARYAEPLMPDGGTLLTMSFYGAEKVVPNYNLMGPVKAALEATARYLAAELGPRGIRVHAVSPGPLDTRAASGLRAFDELLAEAGRRAPASRRVGIDDVGRVTAFLASDAARLMTGGTIYVDGGYSILG